MSKTTTRYIVSTIITFTAGFLVVITPEISTLSMESIQGGALIALILTGVRAGIKAVAEAFLMKG